MRPVGPLSGLIIYPINSNGDRRILHTGPHMHGHIARNTRMTRSTNSGNPHRTSGTPSAKRERSKGKEGCSRDAILALRLEPPAVIHEQFTIISPCRLALRTLPEPPNVTSPRPAITIISPRFVSHRHTTKTHVRVVQCRYAELCKVGDHDRFRQSSWVQSSE